MWARVCEESSSRKITSSAVRPSLPRPHSCWNSQCAASRLWGSCAEHKGEDFCLKKRSSRSQWAAAAWGLTPRHSRECGDMWCQKTPSSLLLLSAELGRCVSFVCVCSRLRIASLIPTTCIVSPNNAGAQNRGMNGTWPQLLRRNLDTAYLGVSFFLSFRRWCSSIIAQSLYSHMFPFWSRGTSSAPNLSGMFNCYMCLGLRSRRAVIKRTRHRWILLGRKCVTAKVKGRAADVQSCDQFDLPPGAVWVALILCTQSHVKASFCLWGFCSVFTDGKKPFRSGRTVAAGS